MEGQHPSNTVVISDDEEEKLEGQHPANPIVISDDEEEWMEGEHPSNPIVVSDDDEVEEEDPQPPVLTPQPSPEYGGDIDSELEYIEIANNLQVSL